MQLQYTLSERDYLNFQLFTASKSRSTNRKMKTEWIFHAAGSLFTALILYVNQIHTFGLIVFFISCFIILFYPNFFIWQYHNRFQSHLREIHYNRLEEETFMEIKKDTIHIKDQIGESFLYTSEIKHIDETQEYIFANFTTGAFFIAPKDQIRSQLGELKALIQKSGIELNQDLNWHWDYNPFKKIARLF